MHISDATRHDISPDTQFTDSHAGDSNGQDARQQAMALMEESLAAHQGPGCETCRAELRHIQEMSVHYPNDVLVMLDRWTAKLRKNHLRQQCGQCPATKFRAWNLDATPTESPNHPAGGGSQ